MEEDSTQSKYFMAIAGTTYLLALGPLLPHCIDAYNSQDYFWTCHWGCCTCLIGIHSSQRQNETSTILSLFYTWENTIGAKRAQDKIFGLYLATA